MIPDSAKFAAALTMTVLLLFAGCGEKPRATPATAGHIAHKDAVETSGLASSRRRPDILWIHSDSANQPLLYAIGTDGALRGSVRVTGVKNLDWEDIASFELDGQSWLLIADTGDNNGSRKNCSLLVIAEPDPASLTPGKELAVPVAWRIPVVYQDGGHDCEAVAVDAKEETVFLVTKRTHPPMVHSLPLRAPTDGKVPPAALVSRLNEIPQPSSIQKLLPTPTGRYRAQVTGMDISPDRTCAVIVTYGDILLFPRKPGETWAQAFGHSPEVLAPHNLPQAEAVCFSYDGSQIFVTGERGNQPLLRYQLPSRNGN